MVTYSEVSSSVNGDFMVRDLYLSPKNRYRRSCFAFVRFATLEEAERVEGLMECMCMDDLLSLRLSWIEFKEVPLNCWCEKFFFRMGWGVGEPLAIEADTISKRRKDRGRVLLLKPPSLVCPESIKVIIEKSSFLVSSSEVQGLVDLGWISDKLGLYRDNYGIDYDMDSCMEKVQRWVGGSMVEQRKSGFLKDGVEIDGKELAYKTRREKVLGVGLDSRNLSGGNMEKVV
ncbi:hypothetical protein Q3G72_017735 [Acer saccharum]|nr:hypothetical protein Q3G72_017735 [Acer saccharum]